jgi:hypothetical protein
MATKQQFAQSDFPDVPRGMDLLNRQGLNKGTAFTEEERNNLGLHGLLPPYIESLEQQVVRAYGAYKRKDDDLERHIYLRALQDTNEVLFYRLLHASTDRPVGKYIENEGIEVIDSIAFEIPDNLEVGLRDPLQLIEDVQRLNTKGADVVVASACVQMPSLAAIPHIEDMLGIRTVSTAVCTTRSMLDWLGLEPIVPAAGALLAGSTTTDRTSEDVRKAGSLFGC